VLLKMIKKLLKKDIKTYLPKILQSNKTILQMQSKIKSYYSKKEIVEYFSTLSENYYISLTENDDLYLHGEKLQCFDDWLKTVLNLMIFAIAHETYENNIEESLSLELQLSCAGELKKTKKLSREQYLCLVEVINCRTDIRAGKV
jgi:hypothetical protein